MAAANSAKQALSTALRELGLRQRKGKDADGYTAQSEFSVRDHIYSSHYRRTGERIREFTYAALYTRRANDLVADNAEQIERRCAELGYTFKVRVDTTESGKRFASISD